MVKQFILRAMLLGLALFTGAFLYAFITSNVTGLSSFEAGYTTGTLFAKEFGHVAAFYGSIGLAILLSDLASQYYAKMHKGKVKA
jgi:hypothetical protein